MPAAGYANAFINNSGAIFKALVANLTLNMLSSVAAIWENYSFILNNSK